MSMQIEPCTCRLGSVLGAIKNEKKIKQKVRFEFFSFSQKDSQQGQRDSSLVKHQVLEAHDLHAYSAIEISVTL